MTNNSNIIEKIKELEANSRLIKTAHYLAVKRKKLTHRVLGLLIIIINIMIFSPFLELVMSKYSAAIAVKFLAILSASLAAIQTLFNYQKDIELHLDAGDKYTYIYRKSGVVRSKYMDCLIQQDKFVEEFDALFEDYLDANNQYKVCIPSNSDYNKAQKEINKRDEEKALRKSKQSEEASQQKVLTNKNGQLSIGS
ncbi:hypothetical protein NIES4072_73850 [Nostoc commune NIES-4072]|uniref:SMODS and SLOG-associating 2TM effector domain-containing protein n=1 Tax=Nostoc commune NIES-4072 TaxID=2005467 RepID=A0A2R5G5F0_NOSCO|nr:SLATT domain-containing protein [Nostoc commune]BBD70952.1 hypothetical protein NIES4070_73630 [Nostoc commune HK-02]GBG23673.1 hypothetical protein NIES4072_73850 [Nostoc commune NIES-4072]